MTILYPPVPSETGFTFMKRHCDTYPEIDASTQSDCSGKTVLITGASRGIGLATACSFAAAGVSQIAVAARSDLSSAKQIIERHCKHLGKPVPRILTITLDVQDEASVAAAAKLIETEFGTLDILYNNAGRITTFTPITETDPLSWWNTYEVNLLGTYLCTKAFLPLILRGNDKTIVNVSSIGAHGLDVGASDYHVSKLAIVRFSEFVVREYGEQGVLCYSVHPGGVHTNMGDLMTKDFQQRFLQDKIELPADAFVYLAQTRREWLAGRYIDLTWDIPELLSREKEIVDGDKLKVRLVV